MNINMTLECESCSTHIACRVGMSNRNIQPIRFNCQSCSSPIDINFHGMEPADFNGAKLVEDATPFEQMPFVDLHLDFPVTFEPYVMGMTPFMKAVSARRLSGDASASGSDEPARCFRSEIPAL
jgi:hypothetical protein